MHDMRNLCLCYKHKSKLSLGIMSKFFSQIPTHVKSGPLWVAYLNQFSYVNCVNGIQSLNQDSCVNHVPMCFMQATLVQVGWAQSLAEAQAGEQCVLGGQPRATTAIAQGTIARRVSTHHRRRQGGRQPSLQQHRARPGMDRSMGALRKGLHDCPGSGCDR
jgi:hypothetical protein